MTSASVALPRRIVRRIRPPSAWAVYWALACVIALGFLANAAVGLSLGHPIYLLNAAIWSFDYVLYCHIYRDVRRRERTLDTPLPPVPRWRWVWLASLATFQAFAWLTI